MKTLISMTPLLAAVTATSGLASGLTYPIVGAGQTQCYGNFQAIPPPQPSQPFHGQDAQHPGNAASYRDNHDGTVPDLVAGLRWVQARGQKVSWAEALAGVKACRMGGYTDWRAPTIKEL